jgi:hypothetical protein
MGYLAVKYATNNWGRGYSYSHDPEEHGGCCLFSIIVIIFIIVALTFTYIHLTHENPSISN